MQTSIWPLDVVGKPIPSDKDALNHLKCFLICPFTPKDRFDDLFALVEYACNDVGKRISCRVECVRADKITSAGVIHSEIWTQIAQADVVVADVSGLNGNVMLELGVAAAIKSKAQVIIIKDEDTTEPFLFDIGPARHILYKKTSTGFRQLYADLVYSLMMAVSAAPLGHSGQPVVTLPVNAGFTSGADVPWLVSPDTAHRRIVNGSLEYGSFFVFRNSWLAVANLSIANVEVEAEICFSELRGQKGWIGISLRNQSYFANYGHLFYLTTEGKVIRTEPKDDLGQYDDREIGIVSNFALDTTTPHKFKAKITDTDFFFEIDGVKETIAVTSMPYVYSTGRILLQTHLVRAGLLNLSIKVP